MGYNHLAGMYNTTKNAFADWKDKYITRGMFTDNPSPESQGSMKLANVLGQLASAYDKSIGGQGAIGDAVVNMTTTAMANQARKAGNKTPIKASSVVPTPTLPEPAALPSTTGLPDTKVTPVPDASRVSSVAKPVVATAPIVATPAPAPVMAPSNAEMDPVAMALLGKKASPAYKEPVTQALLGKANTALSDYATAETAPTWSGEHTALLPLEMQNALATENTAKTNKALDVKQSVAEMYTELAKMSTDAAKVNQPYGYPIVVDGVLKQAITDAYGNTQIIGDAPPEYTIFSGPSGSKVLTGAFNNANAKVKQLAIGDPPAVTGAEDKAAAAREKAQIDIDIETANAWAKMPKGFDEKGKSIPAKNFQPHVNAINALVARSNNPAKMYAGIAVATKNKNTPWMRDKQIATAYEISPAIYDRMKAGKLTKADKVELTIAKAQALSSSYNISVEDAIEALDTQE